MTKAQPNESTTYKTASAIPWKGKGAATIRNREHLLLSGSPIFSVTSSKQTDRFAVVQMELQFYRCCNDRQTCLVKFALVHRTSGQSD